MLFGSAKHIHQIVDVQLGVLFLLDDLFPPAAAPVAAPGAGVVVDIVVLVVVLLDQAGPVVPLEAPLAADPIDIVDDATTIARIPFMFWTGHNVVSPVSLVIPLRGQDVCGDVVAQALGVGLGLDDAELEEGMPVLVCRLGGQVEHPLVLVLALGLQVVVSDRAIQVHAQGAALPRAVLDFLAFLVADRTEPNGALLLDGIDELEL